MAAQRSAASVIERPADERGRVPRRESQTVCRHRRQAAKLIQRDRASATTKPLLHAGEDHILFADLGIHISPGQNRRSPASAPSEQVAPRHTPGTWPLKRSEIPAEDRAAAAIGYLSQCCDAGRSAFGGRAATGGSGGVQSLESGLPILREQSGIARDSEEDRILSGRPRHLAEIMADHAPQENASRAQGDPKRPGQAGLRRERKGRWLGRFQQIQQGPLVIGQYGHGRVTGGEASARPNLMNREQGRDSGREKASPTHFEPGKQCREDRAVPIDRFAPAPCRIDDYCFRCKGFSDSAHARQGDFLSKSPCSLLPETHLRPSCCANKTSGMPLATANDEIHRRYPGGFVLCGSGLSASP